MSDKTNVHVQIHHCSTLCMNKPLSYGGWTFYQNSFDDNGRISVIGAVKNPIKMLPWISVMLVFFGMLAKYLEKMFLRKDK